MRIRTKLPLLFLPLTVASTMAILAVLYHSMVKSYEQQAVRGLQDSVTQAARTMDEFIQTRGEDLRVMGFNPLFIHASHQEISAYLALRVRTFSYYRAFCHADNQGLIVASSDPNVIGQPLLKIYPELGEHLTNALTSAPEALFARDLSGDSIHFVSGIADRDGQTEGALVGEVESRYLTEILREIDNRTVGDKHAHLVDRTGVIVLTSSPDRKRKSTHPDFVLPPVQQSVAAGDRGALVYHDASGRKLISGFTRLRAFGDNQVGGDFLFATAPYADVIAPVRSQFASAAILASALCLLSMSVAAFFAGRLGMRIQRLVVAARGIAAGRFESRADLQSDDEVSEVAVAFNSMADHLEQDIIQRECMQRELSKSTARLQAVLDAATQVSIIATTLDGVITIFNRGAEKMLGYTSAEMVGVQTPAILHLPSEVNRRAAELSHALGRPVAGFDVFAVLPSRGEFEEREWTHVRKDGSAMPKAPSAGSWEWRWTSPPAKAPNKSCRVFMSCKREFSARWARGFTELICREELFSKTLRPRGCWDGQSEN
jgi:PAS domain S-box-containing protein